MQDILLKTAGFVVMILLGWASVRAGLLKAEDGNAIGRIVLNITLPCATIAGFSGVAFNGGMLFCFAAFFLYNLIMMVVSRVLVSRGCDNDAAASNLLCCTGSNIGSFSMPYMQTFLPAAVGYLVMTDVGNVLFCLGIGPALACHINGSGEKFSLKKFLPSLFRSVPLDAYLLAAAMSILSLQFPAPVLSVIKMIAQANTFLSMFMIGTQVDIHIDKAFALAVAKIFAARLGGAAAVTALVFLLPLDPLIRFVLIMAAFAPPCSPTVMNVQRAGCDTRVAAMACSLAIPVSVVCFSILVTVLLG